MPHESWKPIRRLSNLREELEETFAELLHEPWRTAGAQDEWHPAIDIYESHDAYLVEADLPGVAPEDVQVRLQGRVLTICGSRRSHVTRRNEKGVHVERSYGTFCRTFKLEQRVDATAVETTCDNGIYRIRLSKKP